MSAKVQEENLFKDWGKRVILEGTPEMIVPHIIDVIEQVKSKGYPQISMEVRTEGEPDFTVGQTSSYRCTIYSGSGGVKTKTGYIKLQPLPKEKTSFRLKCLPASRGFFDHFMQQLLAEFQQLELMHEEEKPVKKTEQKDTAKSPIQLFDSLQFHPKVIEASRKLFKDGHYRDAIFRAFVEVNNFVKSKANSQLDGKKLMSRVFSPANPIIKLNPLKTQTDKDEQEGFMFLFMGAMEGIRNPKGHENIIQNDPYIALKLIGFASLLIQTIDFWEAGKT